MHVALITAALAIASSVFAWFDMFWLYTTWSLYDNRFLPTLCSRSEVLEFDLPPVLISDGSHYLRLYGADNETLKYEFSYLTNEFRTVDNEVLSSDQYDTQVGSGSRTPIKYLNSSSVNWVNLRRDLSLCREHETELLLIIDYDRFFGPSSSPKAIEEAFRIFLTPRGGGEDKLEDKFGRKVGGEFGNTRSSFFDSFVINFPQETDISSRLSDITERALSFRELAGDFNSFFATAPCPKTDIENTMVKMEQLFTVVAWVDGPVEEQLDWFGRYYDETRKLCTIGSALDVNA